MAEEQDSAQERTEQATPRRKQQAHEEGQVVRSKELATTTSLLLAAVGMVAVGPSVARSITDIMRSAFTAPRALAGGELALLSNLESALVDATRALAPFFALLIAGGFLGTLAVGGWSLSGKALSFKWDKLDPVKGMQRVFSWNGLMELLKALVKFGLITGVTLLVLWLGMGEFLSIHGEALEGAIAHAVRLVTWSFAVLGAVTVVVTVVDVPFQIWSHARRLRMTRQQVKEELKETDGRPEVKARVRALQREVAQRRMMEAVPQADVVVTNPTHYAIALRYNVDRMGAPVLVAKGAGHVAERIRRVAEEHAVTVVAAPALARAVYFSTRIDHEIPVGLYVAVAQVLAYVYRLREHTGVGEAPVPPADLPIPPELKR